MKNLIDVRAYIHIEKLKVIKADIGAKCRHLSNRRSTSGERYIDVGVETPDGYKRFQFDFPLDVSDITDSDYERLSELINEKM